MPIDGGLLFNGLLGGTVALALARLLQSQYEQRITDLKERVSAQSAKIESLLKSNDELADQYKSLAESYKALAARRQAQP